MASPPPFRRDGEERYIHRNNMRFEGNWERGEDVAEEQGCFQSRAAWFDGCNDGGNNGGGTWNHRYAPEPYHSSSSAAPRLDHYAPADGAERRRSLAGSYYPERQASRREFSHQYDARAVDHVHHDSPCGPATSVYPTRNYVTPRHHPEDEEARQRAEERKFAQYKSDFSRTSSRRHLLARQSSARIVKGNSPNSKGSNAPTMVEISPGVCARLRGAAETREYIQRDQIRSPALCLVCGLDIFCVPDAEFVLCPQCHVVNPITDGRAVLGGGVGLGITGGMLYSIRQEILQEQRQMNHSNYIN